MVKADTLEQVIWDTVKNILKDPDALGEEFVRRQSKMQQPDERSARRGELLGELKRLSSRENRLLDLYADGEFDKDTLNDKVHEARKRCQSVKEDLSRLDAAEVSQRKIRETSELLRK